MGDGHTYYGLEEFEETKDTINFSYEGVDIEMFLTLDLIYEDSSGNIYQVRRSESSSD